jgi:hypothetical protein
MLPSAEAIHSHGMSDSLGLVSIRTRSLSASLIFQSSLRPAHQSVNKLLIVATASCDRRHASTPCWSCLRKVHPGSFHQRHFSRRCELLMDTPTGCSAAPWKAPRSNSETGRAAALA